MVKISESTGRRKHGPAKESVLKSNPRRKTASKRRSEPAVAAGEHTAKAKVKASANPRQQIPRMRDWRYRDTVTPDDQGDDGCTAELLQRTPTQAEIEPQPQPAESKSPPQRSPLARQASQYVSEDTDEEENERFIETGEHIDEYDDRNSEGVEKLCFEKEEDEPPEEDALEMRDFMRLLRQDGGVFVSKRLRGIVNTGDAAIVLGQIMYWFDCSRTTGRTRAGIYRHDRNWIFKTHAELGRETGIKPRHVRDCLKFLTAKGFIERRYHRANGMRTTYISLNPEKVYQAMQEMEQKRREIAGATCFVE